MSEASTAGPHTRRSTKGSGKAKQRQSTAETAAKKAAGTGGGIKSSSAEWGEILLLLKQRETTAI